MEKSLHSHPGKIYFASDFHFGIPDYESSLRREKMLVAWLENCRRDAAEIFLMGDIFDFWFEYKSVIPKGFVRLLGKLAEITDSRIPVHIFTGNHDIWAFSYLQKEVGLILHRKPEIRDFAGKKFYLAHGDGLGPGDKGYKLLKKVFSSPVNQWLFKWLHPDIGAGLALFFSKKSRIADMVKEGRYEHMNTIEHEMLYHYSKSILERVADVDYFVFGHRHLPVSFMLNERTKLVILGDWLTNFTFAEFDGQDLELKYYNH